MSGVGREDAKHEPASGMCDWCSRRKAKGSMRVAGIPVRINVCDHCKRDISERGGNG